MDKHEAKQPDVGDGRIKEIPVTEKEHRLTEIRKGAEGILFDPGDPGPDAFQQYDPPSQQPSGSPSQLSTVQDSSPPVDSADNSSDS